MRRGVAVLLSLALAGCATTVPYTGQGPHPQLERGAPVPVVDFLGNALSLHEAGHVHDLATRKYKGTYSALRLIPFVDLYQEYKATQETIGYLRRQPFFYLTKCISYTIF